MAKNFRLEQALSRMDRHIETRLFKVAEALRKELTDSFASKSKWQQQKSARKKATLSSSVAEVADFSARSHISDNTVGTKSNRSSRPHSQGSGNDQKSLKYILAEPEYQKPISVLDQAEYDRHLREKIKRSTVKHVDLCLHGLIKDYHDDAPSPLPPSPSQQQQAMVMEMIQDSTDVNFFITSESSSNTVPSTAADDSLLVSRSTPGEQ